MARKRRRLVPPDAVEIFEIRHALYFDEDGQRRVRSVVSTPDDPDLEAVDLVELLGALEYGRQQLVETYDPGVGDEEPR